MASLISEILFSGGNQNRHRREETTCSATPAKRFRSMFGDTRPTRSLTEPRIHPGPPVTDPDGWIARGDSSTPPSCAFANPFSGYDRLQSTPTVADPRELIRWNVVNEKDAQRGFRMFDGVLLSVKDVSSEQLFLERMGIAYAAYDAHVAGLVNRSPLEVTRAMVKAVSACVTKYFSTQSALRTDRPFIAKVLHLDCPDMFCAHSDFVRAYLFTNASAEDEAIIALAENVYAENNFNICADFTDGRSQAAGNNDDGRSVSEADRLFDLGMRIAESSVVGGTHPSFGVRGNPLASTDDSTRRAVTDRGTDSGTAMLIVVTDFEALHNFVSYALYLTPTQLSRRYTVNFDSVRRSTSINSECSRNREARNSRKGDTAKAAIRAAVEKKRREKIDTMGERSEACEAVLQQRAVQMSERNNDVLCHLLLLLFDKCLSALIDRGFENLNSRRGYAVNSAKEIGAATIYTGIIDTVGEISTNLEGHDFESVAGKNTEEHAPPKFTPPANDIVATEDFSVRGVDSDGGRGVTE